MNVDECGLKTTESLPSLDITSTTKMTQNSDQDRNPDTANKVRPLKKKATANTVSATNTASSTTTGSATNTTTATATGHQFAS